MEVGDTAGLETCVTRQRLPTNGGGVKIRPVRPPTRRELEAALAAARPRRSKPGEAERIVAEALRQVRRQLD